MERALARVENLIIEASHIQKKRRPTTPSKAARQKRLDTKHKHSIKKETRRAAVHTAD
jgi:ribosome-associated protein